MQPTADDTPIDSGHAGILPIVHTIRNYRTASLLPDLVAGLSVCLVMIPSVIAYAELAGLAPAQGLYAALAGMTAYALFASSRHVIAGPDAAITLLVAGAIGPLAHGDAGRAALLAAAAALLGGGLMLLAARLRAGVIADFLSKPVLVGYLTGAALILISTQLGKLFGLSVKSHEFFPVVAEVANRLREAHLPTLGIGIGLIIMLESLRGFAPRVPGALVAFVAALLASVLIGLESRGVRVIGVVPEGLPSPRLPLASLQDFRDLLPATVGIVMLTFPEAILLARAFAARKGYEIQPNQELRALAAANFSAACFGGFSVGASQSRTTINEASGGRTQLVSLFAAAALALFLIFLTPLLRALPTVTLAAILISAGVHLIEVREYQMLYRASRRGFWLAIAVTAGVLVVGVVPGILIGVMTSVFYLLARLARPMDAILAQSPGANAFHDLGDDPAGQPVAGVLAYRFYSPLFFANAEYFVQRIRRLILDHPTAVRCVVVDMQAVWEIDVTAADALTRLMRELSQSGISFRMARANRPLRERLSQFGIRPEETGDVYYSSVHAAVSAFRESATSMPAAQK